MAAQDLDQFLVNDLDHLLRRRKRGENFFAHRFLLDIVDQLLYNPEIDVGLEQRDADLAQSALHVFGRELAFSAQVLEHPLQLFR